MNASSFERLHHIANDIYRPVDVVIAAHRRPQKPMGSHHSRGICRSTPTTPWRHGYCLRLVSSSATTSFSRFLGVVFGSVSCRQTWPNRDILRRLMVDSKMWRQVRCSRSFYVHGINKYIKKLHKAFANTLNAKHWEITIYMLGKVLVQYIARDFSNLFVLNLARRNQPPNLVATPALEGVWPAGNKG